MLNGVVYWTKRSSKQVCMLCQRALGRLSNRISVKNLVCCKEVCLTCGCFRFVLSHVRGQVNAGVKSSVLAGAKSRGGPAEGDAEEKYEDVPLS